MNIIEKKRRHKKVGRLLSGQHGLCFFCNQRLSLAEATIEHLVAKSRNGDNRDSENFVACCNTINSMLGNMTVKDKIKMIVSIQDSGCIQCPKKLKEKREAARIINERVDFVLGKLRRTRRRPKPMKSFCALVASFFAKKISTEDVNAITMRLVDTGKIQIDEKAEILYKYSYIRPKKAVVAPRPTKT